MAAASSGQQRPEGRAEVAADLEQRLREAEAAARGEARHARGFRVEGRGADADHPRRQQQHAEAAGHRQQGHAAQGHAHPDRQQEGDRALVGGQADPGLQQRRGALEGQGDQADLGEAERELLLEQRVDRRQDGLHAIVEQVHEGDREQDLQHGAAGGAGLGRGGG
jgi:hypothetical protein